MRKSRKCVFVRAVGALVMGVGVTLLVEGQAAAPNAGQSWTANAQSDLTYGNPSRTTESHIKSGNRTVDKKAVEVLGLDGQYQPFFAVETEQIRESPTLTRSITRTYNPGPNGDDQLTQVTESETQNSADGSARTVQTTSQPDSLGNLAVVGREITATTKSAASQDSQTTVYLPDVDGDLAASMQVNQQEHSAGGETYMKKTTLLPDASRNWQVYESQEKTVKEDTRNRTSEDRSARLDFEGNVSPVSAVITTEKNVNGERTSASQMYSIDVAGSTRSQNLRPLQSSTTVQKTESGRAVTEQQIVQPNPFDPEIDFFNTTHIMVKESSGTEETFKVTAQYPDGSPSVVLLETRTIERLPQ
jgi:hypothetical protein